MFAHWTDMSEALLAGEVPPVFRLKKRKVDDMTEAEEKQKECQQTAAPDVQEVEATEEETSVVVRVIQHCKKAAEWVEDNKNLFAARVEMPGILHMNTTQSEEAAQDMTKMFENVHLNEEETELILEPFKFVFFTIEDMWLFCEEIMDQRKYLAYCEYREDK